VNEIVFSVLFSQKVFVLFSIPSNQKMCAHIFKLNYFIKKTPKMPEKI